MNFVFFWWMADNDGHRVEWQLLKFSCSWSHTRQHPTRTVVAVPAAATRLYKTDFPPATTTNQESGGGDPPAARPIRPSSIHLVLDV
jgi:hypothetical protein